MNKFGDTKESSQKEEHDDFETSALSLNFNEFESALKALNVDLGTSNIRSIFKKSKQPKDSLVEHFKWAEQRREKAIKERNDEMKHVGPTNYSNAEFKRIEPTDFKHTERREFCSGELSLAKICHGAHLKQVENDITPIGSHYLLIHFDVPIRHEDSHTVRVHGLVNKDTTFTMADIRKRPKITQQVLMECAGNGRLHMKNRLWVHVPWGPDAIGCSQWGGISLRELLLEVGMDPRGKQGADKGVQGGEVQYFQRSMSMEEAMMPQVMLAYEMNGQEMPASHGYPLRLIIPGWYGMASVKWLTSIEIIEGGWWGYQMHAYCYAQNSHDADEVPLRDIFVRAVMVPPGFPDFFTRQRLVAPGTNVVVGKAWAGANGIAKVEFSSDNGANWALCDLKPKLDAFAWAPWSITWEATLGGHVLMVKATDSNGDEQDIPSDETFNFNAMSATMWHSVSVRVCDEINYPTTATEVGKQIDLSRELYAQKMSHYGAPFNQEDYPSGHPLEVLTRCAGSQG